MVRMMYDFCECKFLKFNSLRSRRPTLVRCRIQVIGYERNPWSSVSVLTKM